MWGAVAFDSAIRRAAARWALVGSTRSTVPRAVSIALVAPSPDTRATIPKRSAGRGGRLVEAVVAPEDLVADDARWARR